MAHQKNKLNTVPPTYKFTSGQIQESGSFQTWIENPPGFQSIGAAGNTAIGQGSDTAVIQQDLETQGWEPLR